MNFGKLFGKKEKKSQPTTQNKAQAATMNIDQQLNDLELKIKNVETKANNLQEEAKAKLKAGDKAGAKRLLAKKKKYNEQIKQYEGAMAMMEEQKMMLESADSMKRYVR